MMLHTNGVVQIDGAVPVGVDDTGYDVKFFGDTSGQHLLLDQSADELALIGIQNFHSTTQQAGKISLLTEMAIRNLTTLVHRSNSRC